MKKTGLLLVFLLIVPVLFISAEKNYTSEKIVFLPQEFYVGDLVEMRVVVEPHSGAEIRKPERFPDSYWVKIENAEVLELDGKYELRIYLRSFAPGIRTLPPLQFGDVLLRDLRIQTKSVLDENPSGLAPPAEQMLLPGTNYYIALIIGIVFILPVLVILFWNRIGRAVSRYLSDKMRKKPYKKLHKTLSELEKGLNEKRGKVFYTELIDAVRDYFSDRGSFDYNSATMREGIKGIFSDFHGINSCSALAELFRVADEVKFGGRKVVISQRAEHILLVRAASEEIEKLLFYGDDKDADI